MYQKLQKSVDIQLSYCKNKNCAVFRGTCYYRTKSHYNESRIRPNATT